MPTMPMPDMNARRGIVERYFGEGFLKAVEAPCELYSGDEGFEGFYVREKPGLICGTDVFNFNRFPEGSPQFEEFGWLVKNAVNGILLVERPGHPPERKVLSKLEKAGIRVALLQGISHVTGRDIRRKIAKEERITGMVPSLLEAEIARIYKQW